MDQLLAVLDGNALQRDGTAMLVSRAGAYTRSLFGST